MTVGDPVPGAAGPPSTATPAPSAARSRDADAPASTPAPTPEPSWHRPPVPETVGLGPRFVAFTIDFLVASGIFVLLAGAILGALGLAGAFRMPVDLQAWLIPIVILYLPTLLVYFTLGEGLWGTTLGKQVIGLRAVRFDGSPLTLFDSFIRNVLRFVWFLVPIGVLFLLADLYLIHTGELDQRIGDLGAETIVVRARPAGGG